MILDVLCFIENRHGKLRLMVKLDVAPQQRVRCDNQIVAIKIVEPLAPVTAVYNMYLEIGCKLLASSAQFSTRLVGQTINGGLTWALSRCA